MEKATETEFLRLLLGSVDTRPRISALVEAGGRPAADDEPHTISLQWEFADLAGAKKWETEGFADFASVVADKFGERVMVFSSIFEIIRDGAQRI